MFAFKTNEAICNADVPKSEWPKFDAIPEPRMVCLYSGNGSGSKLYQSLLDAHPEIYMVPAYPLMYLYPHWNQWQSELAADFQWPAIIDTFCIKHATLIDSRRIQSFDGMTKLGDNLDQHLEIDEDLFKSFLNHILVNQVVCARTFLLAVHYAYAFCRNEVLSTKKVLVYHIHVPWYVIEYLALDFPDMKILGMVRDPRANLPGRHSSNTSGDFDRLNKTDAIIFQQQAYRFSLRYLLEGLDVLEGMPMDQVRMVRHEDLHHKLEEVMKASARFLGISYSPCLTQLTFGGLKWWGDPVYNMAPMNIVNPRVVSKDWQKRISIRDWFVIEGLMFHYLKRYGYEPMKFVERTFSNQCVLFFAMLLPTKIEIDELGRFIKLSGIRDFWNASLNEASGRTELKNYGFNAFYRHKWTHKHLSLWCPKWYVKLLLRSRHSNSVAFRAAAQTIYVTASAFRFSMALITYPLTIMKRWAVSISSFKRQLQNNNILPDLLH